MIEFVEFFYPLNPFRNTKPSNLTANYQLQKILRRVKSNDGVVLVAEKNEELIGFAGIYLTNQLFEDALTDIPMKLGHIKGLYVKEEYRNKRIGSQLLQSAEKYFEKKGCTHATLSVFGPNKKAQSFYLHNGFTPRYIEMIKQLWIFKI